MGAPTDLRGDCQPLFLGPLLLSETHLLPVPTKSLCCKDREDELLIEEFKPDPLWSVVQGL